MSRLDQALPDRGLAKSRSLAAKLCREGFVLVNGVPVHKPSFEVTEADEIRISDNPLTRFVSRGGLKLEAALKAFGVDVKDKICVDVGASTGGFTDCLLHYGAKRVWAVDSGSGQLHPSLQKDPRVISLEKVNARYLRPPAVPEADVVVMDVSFISQSLLYETVVNILKPDGVFISLVKPQFEVGRDKIGKGGVVRDEKARAACLDDLMKKAAAAGLVPEKTMASPLTGGDGNVEYLALFHRKKENDP